MNNSFNIIGLDFDETKASLQTYLSSQETLKDYNFDGSVLSTLLDVLAYNTHYQAFYANMVANEMFLDSAVMRPSVVSHAKALGYVPSSRRASSSVMDLTVSVSVTENTYLTRGAEFTGTDGEGTQYRFVTLDTVYANTQTNKFEGVKVYEGTIRRMSYIYDPSSKETSVLLIPNDKIDTSTIRVRVYNSTTDATGGTDTWTLATSYIDLTPTSKVYFLQEREAGMYELYFGDNFLGQKPEAGNLVVVEYLETTGEPGNGISAFSTSISNISGISASVSAGGAAEESVSNIKFLAPKYYATQSRAVTENDYMAIVRKEYPNTGSIYVYGGETTTPPQYGKVFIALKPKSGSALTNDEKSTLVRKLRNTSTVMGIIPEIVDADHIDLVFDSVVTYDPAVLSYSEGTLKALIVAYMFAFSTASLEAFGSNFYLSKLTQGINNISPAIISNQTTVSMRKSVELNKLLASKGFSIDFTNPLYHPHDGHTSILKSSTISHVNTSGILQADVRAVDDGFGNIDLVRKDESGNQIVVYPKIGTVDYETGVLRFSSKFAPQTAASVFTVTVEPRNTDLYVFENKIMRISRGYSDSIKVSTVNKSVRRQNLKA